MDDSQNQSVSLIDSRGQPVTSFSQCNAIEIHLVEHHILEKFGHYDFESKSII